MLTAERSLAAVGWRFLSDLLFELQDFLNELLGGFCNITFGRIFLEHKLRPCDIGFIVTTAPGSLLALSPKYCRLLALLTNSRNRLCWTLLQYASKRQVL